MDGAERGGVAVCGPRGQDGSACLCSCRAGVGGAGPSGTGLQCQALLPPKQVSNPSQSPHLHQCPRPGQPPASLLLALPVPPRCLHTFSLQTPEAWLKTTDRAHHSPFKNPAVASCCTWNKMQAPSVSAQQALPNSNFVLIPGHRLSHTGLISVP